MSHDHGMAAAQRQHDSMQPDEYWRDDPDPDCDRCDDSREVRCDQCGGAGEHPIGYICTSCDCAGVVDCPDCTGAP